MSNDRARPFPIIRGRFKDTEGHMGARFGDSTIPLWLARICHRGYVNMHGNIQSLERLEERGGLHANEIVPLLAAALATDYNEAHAVYMAAADKLEIHYDGS